MTKHNSNTALDLWRGSKDEFVTPFGSLFDDFLSDRFPTLSSELGSSFFSKGSYPRVDVIDYPDKVVIEAEPTGLTKDEIAVELEGDTLVIKGDKVAKTEPTESNGKYLYREIKRSSFQRSFVLGTNVDKDNIKVDYNNGLLKIEAPKTKVEPPKQTRKKLF